MIIWHDESIYNKKKDSYTLPFDERQEWDSNP